MLDERKKRSMRAISFVGYNPSGWLGAVRDEISEKAFHEKYHNHISRSSKKLDSILKEHSEISA